MKKLLLVVLTLLMLLSIIPALAENSDGTLSWVDSLGLASDYSLESDGYLKITDLTLPENFSTDDLSISLYRVVDDAENVLVDSTVNYETDDGAYLQVLELKNNSRFIDDGIYYLKFESDDGSRDSAQFALHIYPYITIMRNGKVTITESDKHIKLKAGEVLSVDRSYLENSEYYRNTYKDRVVCWMLTVYSSPRSSQRLVQDTITAEEIQECCANVGGDPYEAIVRAILIDKDDSKYGYDKLWDTYGQYMNFAFWVNGPMLVINRSDEDITEQTLILKAGEKLTVDRSDYTAESEVADYVPYWLIQLPGVSGNNNPNAIQADELNYTQIKTACSGKGVDTLEGVKVYVTLAPAGVDTSYNAMSSYKTAISSGITLKAASGYTVTYKLDENSDDYNVVKTYPKGSTITLPGYHNAEELAELNTALTNAKHAQNSDDTDEYYVTEWLYRHDGNYDYLPLGASLTLEDDVVLEAVSGYLYENEEPTKYNITFKPGSYHGTALTGTEYKLENVLSGSVILAPDPADLGYTAPEEGVEFIGWTDGGDDTYSAGGSITIGSWTFSNAEILFEAKWAKPVTITLVDNEGNQKILDKAYSGSEDKLYEGDMVDSGLLQEEMNPKLETGGTEVTDENAGYTSVQYGWYLDSNANEQYDSGEEYYLDNCNSYDFTLEESITLHALMVEPMKITFKVDEESKSFWYYPGASVELYSDTASIIEGGASKSVVCWKDEEGNSYSAGRSTFNESVTLTAELAVSDSDLPQVTLASKERGYVAAGNTVYSAHVKIAGDGYTHYQWQYSMDRTNWQNVHDVKAYTEETDSTLTVVHSRYDLSEENTYKMSTDDKLVYFRVLAWNYADGTPSADNPHTTTEWVTIAQILPSAYGFDMHSEFRFNGEDKYLDSGDTCTGYYGVQYTLSLKAYYNNNYNEVSGYQWYRSTDGGSNWTVLDSGNTVTETIEKDNSVSRVLYYCAVTFPLYVDGDYENYTYAFDVLEVDLTDSITIQNQPENKTIELGNSTTLSIGATNATAYQWQIKDGGDWKNIGGAISKNYSYTGTAIGAVQLRCKLYNANTEQELYSNAATVTVNPKSTTGTLTLTLGEISGTNLPENVSVQLKITLKQGENAIPNGTYGAASFTDGVGYVTLARSGESGIALQDAQNTATDTAVITGVPMNTSYTVTSMNPSYTVTSGASGTIDSGAVAVTLNLSYQKQSEDAMVMDDEIRAEGGATRDDIEVTAQLLDNDDVNEKDVYSVEINWGDMKFKYVTTQYKKNVWNTETHTYTTIADESKPDEHEWQLYTTSQLNLPEGAGKVVTDADQSYVVVFNHSNRPVDVQLANEDSRVSGVTVNLLDKLNTGIDGVYALNAGVEGTVYDAQTGAAAKVNVSGDPVDVNDLAQETEEASAENPTVLTQLKVTISKHTAAEEE